MKVVVQQKNKRQFAIETRETRVRQGYLPMYSNVQPDGERKTTVSERCSLILNSVTVGRNYANPEGPHESVGCAPLWLSLTEATRKYWLKMPFIFRYQNAG